MRIRKRKVPFPISSLSPVPLSDPQFGHQLQLQSNPNQNFSPADDKVSNFGPHSSDQPNHPIAQDSSQQNKKEGKEGQKTNDSRKGNFSGARTPNMFFQESTSFAQGKEDVEETKFKKIRKGSVVEKDKKMKSKIRSKENGAKKKVRGGAVMEGSRCSRVNGRGWRCCQPTLVGYSLCEHHLGKGRLRSITNTAPINLHSKPLEAAEETKDKAFDVCGNEEEPPLSMSKKKKKLGMVKARSISSLLG